MEYSFASYQIAEMASEMEKEGGHFYQQLADFSKDEAVKELFSYLAKSEKKHEKDFLSIAQDTKASEEVYAYHVNIAGMMKSGIKRLKRAMIYNQQIDMPQALEIAINGEELAVEVYSEILGAYSEQFSKVLEKIIAQEKSHLKRIKNLKQILQPDQRN